MGNLGWVSWDGQQLLRDNGRKGNWALQQTISMCLLPCNWPPQMLLKKEMSANPSLCFCKKESMNDSLSSFQFSWSHFPNKLIKIIMTMATMVFSAVIEGLQHSSYGAKNFACVI